MRKGCEKLAGKGFEVKVFEKSEWIWLANGETDDQYAEFCDRFVYQGGKAEIRISADSNYTLFVNGRYIASGQYGDYEHYKIYDTVDLSEAIIEGENRIDLTVYHCGTATARYCPAAAGVIYEVEVDGEIVAKSSEKTLSRQSPNYKSGLCRLLSSQLGYTFEYDASVTRDGEYFPSRLVSKKCEFFPRPIKKHLLLERRPMKSVTRFDSKHYLVDLGGECVGLPTLDLFSETKQTVTVAFGEHIKDGCVRKVIGKRNLYYTYKTSVGENLFTEYMLRLGCRYLEVFSEEPIELRYVGLLPQVYEVNERTVKLENELDQKIYDACLNTLRLCMMEHYVDCPWREQALYAFDSRNQMLCGYYAFENGNADYARANLKLISKDRRSDGLLSLTYPSSGAVAIPSFSLHYIIAMWEYVLFTGDFSLAAEAILKMKGILEAFLKNRKDGLIRGITDTLVWNFYDWTDDSNYGWNSECEPDLFINCLFILALDAYEKMCEKCNLDSSYKDLKQELTRLVRDSFLTDKKLFTTQKGKEVFTILGNSLAILSGVATECEREAICKAVTDGKLLPCSLSAKVTEYSALLMTNKEKYRDFILNEIRQSYSAMLNAGSDTVWETLGGCDDFSGAGSLCHGWSSVPIYFYHKLLL